MIQYLKIIIWKGTRERWFLRNESPEAAIAVLTAGDKRDTEISDKTSVFVFVTLGQSYH